MSTRRNRKDAAEEVNELNESLKPTVTLEETIKEETFIYCGPTLKDGILQQNSVFRGELPQHIVDLWKKHPVLSELFVSTTVFANVSKNIKIQGTREHQLFQQALKVAQGGSK